MGQEKAVSSSVVNGLEVSTKNILQDLCKQNHAWDKDLPEHHVQMWQEWLTGLRHIGELAVTRCMKPAQFGNRGEKRGRGRSGVEGAAAAIHSMTYFYTSSEGISNFPEFICVGEVDGIQISYYDSEIKEAVPKQDWMEFKPDYWRGETHAALGYMYAFKADLDILKHRFNHTKRVHTVQKEYGCVWDDKAGVTGGFERFAYDGEDFMALELDNLRWIAAKSQASTTIVKWNSDASDLKYRKHYFQICAEWLKKYVSKGQHALKRRVPPEVSVFKKDSEVVCLATGFYPAVMIMWLEDGVEVEDDVDVGETLPNVDGTFQKRVVLTVPPEERKKAQYSCEITHMSRAEPVNMILHSAELNRNGNGDSGIGMIIGVIAAVLVGLIVGIVVIVMKKKAGKEYDKVSCQDTSSDISNPINPEQIAFIS
ncbi:major histocompatibility complex class I-related gene protein-like [Engraulis encrasicolus]|uniref:major histocompatibility complex class I-related gene protein-like n=1 Tax=Engraulis encrasicolus TaxID=184585 RepID=UPI002FD4D655